MAPGLAVNVIVQVYPSSGVGTPLATSTEPMLGSFSRELQRGEKKEEKKGRERERKGENGRERERKGEERARP
jgi:hypothetical protein